MTRPSTHAAAQKPGVSGGLIPAQYGIRRPRVLILAFGAHVSDRVVAYAHRLLEQGSDVELVVIDERRRGEVHIDPRVPVHRVMTAEEQRPVRRLERLFVYRLPGGVLARAERLLARSRLTRPMSKVVRVLVRLHRRIAGGVHRRLFTPVYRHFKGWTVARIARRRLSRVFSPGFDAIVAADLDSIPLGCRLARRYPRAVARASLDPQLLAAVTRVHAAPG
jgi:hypothetical protein